MTYKEFEKNQEKLVKQYHRIYTIKYPKNEMDYKPFDEKPSDWYYITFRRPTKNEWSIFQKNINNGKLYSAYESLFENTYLEGDDILIKNDDYFINICNRPDTIDTIKYTLVANEYFIDKENLTCVIKKDHESIKDIKEDFKANPDKYSVYKFRKPNRKDLERTSASNNTQYSATILKDLCIEGNRLEIITNDDVFFILVYGNEAEGSINEMLFPEKIMELKKN